MTTAPSLPARSTETARPPRSARSDRSASAAARAGARAPQAGRGAALAAVAGLAAAAGSVHAQAPDTSDTDGPRWTVGAVAVHAPRHEGADDDRTRTLPLLNYRNGRFFAGALGGIGYDLSTTPGVRFGPLLSYRGGRDEDDAARLRGLGDIDAGADVGAFVRWVADPFFVHATLRHGVGGDAVGTQLRLGTGWSVAVTPADRVVVDASVDWADRDVMQGWFGVSAAQAARSGLAAHAAGSGVRRVGVGAVWTHAFTPRWFSTVGVAAWRLGDAAADSPITVDRDATAVSVGIGHRF